MNEFKVPVLPPSVVSCSAKKTVDANEPEAEIEFNSIEKTEETHKPLPVKSKELLSSVAATSCRYLAPKWSGTPAAGVEYYFEVLKSGQIIENIKNLGQKPYWIFGRLPGNDVEMAHPTISRFHAILQYRPKVIENLQDEQTEVSEKDEDDPKQQKKKFEEGWYIYDLGSTHGTFLNKMRIPPKVYIRMKVGHMLKLGASTRCFILQGPASDEEPESELTVTEMRDARARAEEQKIKDAQIQLEAREKEGISWGMSEDADEETDLSVNPYASSNNEELFLDDPKKTLRGFFEREGLPLEYKCDEMSTGSFVCSVELPIDDLNGRPIVAEVSHKGRKKDCVVQCALEACRILDRHGVLRQANHEPLKRKIQKDDSDDDDDYLDRTGDIERKKMRKNKTGTTVTLTYTDLLSQEVDLLGKINKVNEDIVKYQDITKRLKVTSDQQDDDLDSFMHNLNNETPSLDKIEIRKLRVEHQRLKIEHQKLQRLIKIAKPIDMVFTRENFTAPQSATSAAAEKKIALPMIGKRNQYKFTLAKPLKKLPVEKVSCSKDHLKFDDVEEEQEEKEEGENVIDNLTKEGDKKTEETTTINASDEIQTQSPPEDKKQFKALENRDSESEIVSLQKNHTILSDNAANEGNSTEQLERSVAAKRRRNRQRIRNKRQEVDIEDLDEHEASDKYSKWVPPENQSGDGFTSLNEKFGY